MQLDISANLKLQNLALTHAKPLFDCVQSSRASLQNVLPWVATLHTEADAERYIDTRINNQVGGLWSAIEFNCEFCGVFGIKYMDAQTQTAEIGYWLGEKARGHGLIGLVLEQVIAKLREVSDIKTVEFQCLQSNIASQRIIEKIGGQFVESCVNDLGVASDESLYIYRLAL